MRRRGAAVSGVGWYAFSDPPVQHLALPPHLVDATSTEGRRLLAEALAKADFEQLAPHFVVQSRRGFCGVATGSMVINAVLHPPQPVTQAAFFGADAAGLGENLAVSMRGMTLDQLARLLRSHGLNARVIHAADSNVEAFRTLARETLSEAEQLIVVNYDRRRLGQDGAGHISPIGAYHAETDRVLVMDVAAYKYPHTWVKVQDLWSAMDTVDPDSARTRGFLLVRLGEGAAGRSAALPPAATR
jgi:hypothetical protein